MGRSACLLSVGLRVARSLVLRACVTAGPFCCAAPGLGGSLQGEPEVQHAVRQKPLDGLQHPDGRAWVAAAGGQGTLGDPKDYP